MALIIPDEILETTQMKPEELLQELAVALYMQERISLAQAARLAKLNRLQFQHLLASRDLVIHFDPDDLEADLETLKSVKPQ
jgi:predicted HTH domain antitoxin